MKELSFQRNCGAASVGECNKVMWYFQLKILFLKRKIYMCIYRKLNTSRFYMLKKLLVTVCYPEASSISQPQFKPCFVPLTFGNVSILWPLKLHCLSLISLNRLYQLVHGPVNSYFWWTGCQNYQPLHASETRGLFLEGPSYLTGP